MGEAADLRTRNIVAIGCKVGGCGVCRAPLAAGGVELGLVSGARIWICGLCASRASDVELLPAGNT